ncbi:hypothetical protein AJ80_03778 [Polytolypa hystricis UAMH7299]|uniref:Ribonuclease T2-like n=1 Tax=Polytolypa hystricis (strain UAMH7299) TaxID=1447883 RepID=A0A2B7YFP8_POLH7|nr:hypothetical protein AJ80_03778 [Polytolypa hystricis UAMH7299]
MLLSIPSTRSMRAISLLYLTSFLVPVLAEPKTCPVNSPLSCSGASGADTCCYNDPGGLILLTQFWDSEPATGPNDSWTIHGLWPDNCDGSWEQYCDKSREYSNMIDIIRTHGQTNLLDYMSTYWKDYQGDDESFWAHEWNKHGTCMSTFETGCYTAYEAQEEVVDYFKKTVELFQGLDTYQILADAGIRPDSSKTYALSELQNAISTTFGRPVTLNCKNSVLNEVWYFYNVRGSALLGEYIPTNPAGSTSTCPSTGIKYLPKGNSPSPPTTTSTSTTPEPTSPGDGDSFSGKGYLQVTTSGSQRGCLISNGKWYTTGTCATYTANKPASGEGFTLTSSKGSCGIVNDAFECGSGVPSGTFTANNGRLSVSSSYEFYADNVPSGTAQLPIYTSRKPTEVTVTWEAL